MKAALIWILLPLGLTSCCPLALRCSAPVEIKATVPAPLLVNQSVPAWKGGTVRDALHYAAESNAADQACEDDRTRIRSTQVPKKDGN